MITKAKPTPETEYKRPELTIYGSMVTLTAAGSKNVPETGMGTQL